MIYPNLNDDAGDAGDGGGGGGGFDAMEIVK